jgi:hypothetical protein
MGTGRRTVARWLASYYGLHYINIGYLFRVLVYKVLEEGVDIANEEALVSYIENFLKEAGSNIPSRLRLMALRISEMNQTGKDFESLSISGEDLSLQSYRINSSNIRLSKVHLVLLISQLSIISLDTSRCHYSSSTLLNTELTSSRNVHFSI